MAERDPYFAESSLVELLVGAGFLLVYFLEEFITLLAGNKHHHNDPLECNIPSVLDKSSSSSSTSIKPFVGVIPEQSPTVSPTASTTIYESMAQRHSAPTAAPPP